MVLHYGNSSTSNWSSAESPPPGLTDSAYQWISIYLLLAGLVATTGNLTVIYVIGRDKKLRMNSHNLLLLNLALADLGFTFCGYPLTGVSAYYKKWMWGDGGCVFYGFMCTLLALTDINILLLLSVYRFVIICKPQYQYIVNRQRNTMIYVALCWLYSLFWALAALLGWSHYTYEAFGTSCSIAWESRHPGDVAYTVLMTVFCYISHIIVMGYCYVKVRAKCGELTSSTLAKTSLCVDDARLLNRLRKERRVTFMAFLMVGVFVVIWSPYAWVAFWRMVDPTLDVAWTTLPTLFAKASPMLNPIIYASTNRKFRQAAFEAFSCPFKCHPQPRAVVLRLERSKRILRMKECIKEKKSYTVETTKDGVYIGPRVIRLEAEDLLF